RRPGSPGHAAVGGRGHRGPIVGRPAVGNAAVGSLAVGNTADRAATGSPVMSDHASGREALAHQAVHLAGSPPHHASIQPTTVECMGSYREQLRVPLSYWLLS